MDRKAQGRRTVFPMQRVKIADQEDDGKRRFEGYAAVFGNRDSYGDIIMKGAFERTLRERPDIKVLWQHDTKQPIGRNEAAYEDDYGLKVRGVLTDIPLVRDTAVPLMADGVVNGLSIGYDVVVEEHNTDMEAWLLKDIELLEYSPVTFPANERAIVSAVKSLDSRADMHTDSVGRAIKTLVHEFEGYFADSDRRGGLDFGQLKRLGDLLAGVLPDTDPDQLAAADADLIEAFNLGAKSVLEIVGDRIT